MLKYFFNLVTLSQLDENDKNKQMKNKINNSSLHFKY